MFAVVEIAGNQYEIRQNDVLTIPRQQGEPGDMLEFGNILLAGDDDNTTIGTPKIEGKVEAKIVEHTRGDKMLIFHKKRRKGYRKLNGYRSEYTNIEITNISVNN
jgi:large subunit ribosomal protein L21